MQATSYSVRGGANKGRKYIFVGLGDLEFL